MRVSLPTARYPEQEKWSAFYRELLRRVSAIPSVEAAGLNSSVPLDGSSSESEVRYEGQPLESLQGLDREGRVIYIGTFSRTVFSALRIGYLIAPKRLVQAFTATKWLCDRHTATLEQATLAEFISSGMYERYLRRVRRRNSSRREALMSAIRTHLGNRVEVTGSAFRSAVPAPPASQVVQVEGMKRVALGGCDEAIAKVESTGVKVLRPGQSASGPAKVKSGSHTGIYAGVAVAAAGGIGAAVALSQKKSTSP